MEYPQHKHAKERLAEILKTASYHYIRYEVRQPKTMLPFLGDREYIADIQASKKGRIYIFEIDGIKNHSTRRNVAKDKARDRALGDLERWTIRISTGSLIGRKKLSDREILDEIEWQCGKISLVVSVPNY